jgi:threonine dehydratase
MGRRTPRGQQGGPADGDRVIGFDDITLAANRLVGITRATPVTLSSSLSTIAGRSVLTKPEHLQRTGSFKIRGAYNRIAVIAESGSRSAVVAASAGNHAQGVALAAALNGLRATIFMPIDASLPKVEATRSYGASIIHGGDTIDDCIAAAREYAAQSGAEYVPPFDDPLVIAGQGTVGLELLSEAPPAEVVVVPVGGGGLIAGIGVALAQQKGRIRLVGVEPKGAASMGAALAHGGPVLLDECDTLADGVAVRRVSELTFEHATEYVDEMVTVDDEQISQAVLLLLERCKWVVEPAGAIGLAAILAGKITGTGPALTVLSGGNVDPLVLTRLIEHGLTVAGRYLRLRVILRDRPGALADLTRALAGMRLNILAVEHRRSGVHMDIGQVEVFLTMETRDPSHRDQVIAELGAKGMRAELLD